MDLPFPSYQVVGLLIDLAIKSTVLLLIIGAGIRLFARQDPAWTSLLWAAALVALIALPGASVLGTGWEVPVLDTQSSTLQLTLLPVNIQESTFPSCKPIPTNQGLFQAFVPLAGMSLLAVVYFVGLFWRLSRIGTGWWQVCLLRKEAEILDQTGRVSRWCDELGIRHKVFLGISNSIRSPIAIGGRQPMILIPRGLYFQVSEKELDCIALHELAHLKRRDITMHYWAMLVSALYWFHPLVHFARLAWIASRERACDDWAIDKIDSHDYAAALIKVVSCLSPQPLMGSVVEMARGNDITERIERVVSRERTERVCPNGWLRLSIVAGILILSSIIGGTHSKSSPWLGPETQHIESTTTDIGIIGSIKYATQFLPL